MGAERDEPADEDLPLDDADEVEEADAVEDPAGVVAVPAGSRRWAAVGGVLALAYVVWYVADLVLLDTRPFTYVTVHRTYGNLAVRLVFAGVLLGLLFHAIDGLRSTLTDLVPAVARRDLALRAGARFLTFAVWVPATLVLLWPAVRTWFAR